MLANKHDVPVVDDILLCGDHCSSMGNLGLALLKTEHLNIEKLS